MIPETGWFPLALAEDLEPGTSFGTRLFGRELVLWRDDAGQSHVWEDRCPHRGMRLSFGFVRGSHIACLYHGWQFDAGGRCRYIPAHPSLEVPASITVERFASAERLGIVWVASEQAAGAEPPPGGNAATAAVRSVAIMAPAARVLAALSKTPPPLAGLAVTLATEGALVTASAGVERLHIAVQPVSAGDTTLHLALEAGSAVPLPEVSRWAEALRRAAESPAVTEAAA